MNVFLLISYNKAFINAYSKPTHATSSSILCSFLLACKNPEIPSFLNLSATSFCSLGSSFSYYLLASCCVHHVLPFLASVGLSMWLLCRPQRFLRPLVKLCFPRQRLSEILIPMSDDTTMILQILFPLKIAGVGGTTNISVLAKARRNMQQLLSYSGRSLPSKNFGGGTTTCLRSTTSYLGRVCIFIRKESSPSGRRYLRFTIDL